MEVRRLSGDRDHRTWASGFVLSAANYDALTGSTIGLVNAVPLLLIVAAAVGAWVALRLKRTRPAAYAVLGQFDFARAQGLGARPPTR